jgi:hypothetical protein
MNLPVPPNRLTLQRLLCLVLAAGVIAIAWLKPLDESAKTHIESGLKRALATYAVARTINGVISVVQETGVSVQPGGVGMTLAPGQLLDPLNDLIEQVSSVMLAVCVSFGIQLMLVHIGGSALVSAVMTAGVLAVACRWWRRIPIPRWEARLVVAMILVRFAVPLAATGSELTYGVAMADAYRAAQDHLALTSGSAAPGAPAEAAKEQSVWDFVKGIFPGSKKTEPEEAGRIEQIKARFDGAVEHVLRLVAIFVVQTVLLPLLFIGLLSKLLHAIAVPSRAR